MADNRWDKALAEGPGRIALDKGKWIFDRSRLNEVFYARNFYNNTMIVVERGNPPTKRSQRDMRWAKKRLLDALWNVREDIALLAEAADGTDPMGRKYREEHKKGVKK